MTIQVSDSASGLFKFIQDCGNAALRIIVAEKQEGPIVAQRACSVRQQPLEC